MIPRLSGFPYCITYGFPTIKVRMTTVQKHHHINLTMPSHRTYWVYHNPNQFLPGSVEFYNETEIKSSLRMFLYHNMRHSHFRDRRRIIIILWYNFIIKQTNTRVVTGKFIFRIVLLLHYPFKVSEIRQK